jgi:hypothetical protein
VFSQNLLQRPNASFNGLLLEDNCPLVSRLDRGISIAVGGSQKAMRDRRVVFIF